MSEQERSRIKQLGGWWMRNAGHVVVVTMTVGLLLLVGLGNVSEAIDIANTVLWALGAIWVVEYIGEVLARV